MKPSVSAPKAVAPLPAPAPVAEADATGRALAWAQERLGDACGANGERFDDHARGTVEVLRTIMADETACVAAALFAGGERLPLDEIEREFGEEVRGLVDAVRQVMRLRGLHASMSAADGAHQAEVLRRMVLTLAADIRVVLIRLASRLQTLRYHAAQRTLPEPALAHETLEVVAPLANRLGLWQLKWELEDLAFRFLDGATYKAIAAELEEKRREREAFIVATRERLEQALARAGIACEVTGRPKHIYSIYAKMRSKGLTLSELRDLRGLRVIVDDVRRCYEALSTIHQLWTPISADYDDYIARPKPNGYQSLHTVVLADDGKPLEVQIRTREMHRHAEYGVASHWSYKERSTGLSGGARTAATDEARIAWVRQLLAWQREMGAALGGGGHALAGADAHIYVMTPQAKVVELPAGSTPVDFAYHVHTSLGHRCRGARVDGHMVPLNTVLANGQTVEIVTARTGAGEGPSRDWLNPDLGYVRSPRARTKVRQWFNARELERDAAAGRERVERVLQREGRTALAFEELAARLSQASVEALFVAVARDEVGPRQLEEAVRGEARAPATREADERLPSRPADDAPAKATGDVLVVGVDLLLTQLARCCRPAPPDPIIGFVTRGRGVSVHRRACPTFARMMQRAPERVLETAWGDARPTRLRGYPVDVVVQAADRPGLLRDISDVFARDRMNVTAVKTLSRAHVASMQFTVEVPDTAALARVLGAITEVSGVFEARRREG